MKMYTKVYFFSDTVYNGRLSFFLAIIAEAIPAELCLSLHFLEKDG